MIVRVVRPISQLISHHRDRVHEPANGHVCVCVLEDRDRWLERSCLPPLRYPAIDPEKKPRSSSYIRWTIFIAGVAAILE
ncbi:hypothetical protein AND_009074 [Anopheles darlingi]|uniref:Uncharacterized protein n=1 Tax=Anopheles darlingi TaxID=43151 RepID=W5J7G1_ANODA|nr:hypothetical protein AND_009074 [Anopheles darlingi]